MVAIEKELRTSYPDQPELGEELGGILLGRTSSEGARLVIHVESVVPIACEYRYGAEFRCSETDLEMLEAQVRRLGRRGFTPVGVYRTHTRKQVTGAEPTLDSSDVELMTALGLDAMAFLLVQPISGSRILGNLYLCKGKYIHEQTEFVPFPFDGAPFEVDSPAPATREPWFRAFAANNKFTVWLLISAIAAAVIAIGLLFLSGTSAPSNTQLRTSQQTPPALDARLN